MSKLTKVIKRDLGTARNNQRLPVAANGWQVEQIQGPAELRVESKSGHPYPLQKYKAVQLPTQQSEFYLSNPASGGKLIIHFLQEDGLQPLDVAGVNELLITNVIERDLDLTKEQEIILDTTSFGRTRVEIIAATFDSSGNYPGTGTTFRLYSSPDQVKWYENDTRTGTIWQSGYFSAIRYIKLVSDAQSAATDETVDLILTAAK